MYAVMDKQGSIYGMFSNEPRARAFIRWVLRDIYNYEVAKL